MRNNIFLAIFAAMLIAFTLFTPSRAAAFSDYCDPALNLQYPAGTGDMVVDNYTWNIELSMAPVPIASSPGWYEWHYKVYRYCNQKDNLSLCNDASKNAFEILIPDCCTNNTDPTGPALGKVLVWIPGAPSSYDDSGLIPPNPPTELSTGFNHVYKVSAKPLNNFADYVGQGYVVSGTVKQSDNTPNDFTLVANTSEVTFTSILFNKDSGNNPGSFGLMPGPACLFRITPASAPAQTLTSTGGYSWQLTRDARTGCAETVKCASKGSSTFSTCTVNSAASVLGPSANVSVPNQACPDIVLESQTGGVDQYCSGANCYKYPN